MRVRLLALAGLLVACAPPLFGRDSDIPQGLSCAGGGACPPGQACVAAEGLCRVPCTQPRPGCGQQTGGSNDNDCGCPDAGQHGSFICDADLFCRPSCFSAQPGGTMPMCLGTTGGAEGTCGSDSVCDPHYTICRPLCPATSGCAADWVCGGIDVGACEVCQPPAVLARNPDGGDVDGGVDGGAGFVSVSAGTSDGLRSVRGNGDQDVYAVTDGGKITHLQGGVWTAQAVPGATSLSGLWVKDTTVIAVGAGGLITTSNGTGGWDMVRPVTQTLYDVHGIDSSNVWAVGQGGTIVHYNGGTWMVQASGTTNDLYRVWAVTGTEVYAVGANGTVLQTLDGGGQWMTRTTPPGTAGLALRGLWSFGGGIGAAELWVVGDQGSIFQSPDGGHSWIDLHDTSGSTGGVQLHDLWASSQNDVWIVGDQGHIVSSIDRGSSWQRASIGSIVDALQGVYGVRTAGSLRLFVGGDAGRLLEGP